MATHRNAVIAGGVVLFHVAALWALQGGLLHRAVEVVVPATILSEIIAPQPKAQPQPPAPPVQPKAAAPLQKASPPPDKPLPPAVQPAAAAQQAAPSPNAPAVPAAQVAIASPSAPAQPVAVAAAPAAPARVDMPSSSAEYLANPKPAYPPLSKRLGEQGKVVVRVFIATDGTAQKAEINQSSGFERLDQAALATILKWHYIPGKRAGVPEAMWFNVPINFVLE